MKVKEVDFSDWTFSNIKANPNGSKSVYLNCDGRRVNIQTPKMRAPFGLQKNQWNDGDTPKYTLDLSFSKEPNEKLDEFHETLKGLDELVLKEAMEHPKEWFGKNKLSRELAEDLYTSILRRYKDPETKEFTGKYPDTVKLKIIRDGKFKTKAYGPDREPIDIDEALKGGAQVIAIMQISQIWISTMGFGVSLVANQLKVFPAARLTGYCFLPDEDDDEEFQPEAPEKDADGDVVMTDDSDNRGGSDEDDEPNEGEGEGEGEEATSQPTKNSDEEAVDADGGDEEADADEKAAEEVEEVEDEDGNSDEDSPSPEPAKKRKAVTIAKKTSKFSKKK